MASGYSNREGGGPEDRWPLVAGLAFLAVGTLTNRSKRARAVRPVTYRPSRHRTRGAGFRRASQADGARGRLDRLPPPGRRGTGQCRAPVDDGRAPRRYGHRSATGLAGRTANRHADKGFDRVIVTENQLDEWVRGNARDAQGVIVELVWRLVAASSPQPKERRFPLGDSIGQLGAVLHRIRRRADRPRPAVKRRLAGPERWRDRPRANPKLIC